ncbi:hypothetical protein IMZ48_27230 [Candidatus Bathyarchaeota archaeon]|nr:hypothetical protein [Candidatus Bathyarchaeota archaeon]
MLRLSAPLEEGRGAGEDGEQRGGYPEAHARGFRARASAARAALVLAALSAGVDAGDGGLLDLSGGRLVGVERVRSLGPARHVS